MRLGSKQDAPARNVLRPALTGLRNVFNLQQLVTDNVFDGKTDQWPADR